jgi:hypothetical protein
LRVLHCPENVGGNPAHLAAAERAIGLRSHCVVFRPHPFGYQPDEVLWPRPVSLVRDRMDRLALTARALRDFDVVHYNFGQTIMAPRPLPGAKRRLGLSAAFDSAMEMADARVLRGAGKTIVVTFQGDDARQGSVVRERFGLDTAEMGADYYTDETDAEKRRRIAMFSSVAHRIYALNPDMLHVLPPGSRFMPYASVDPRVWKAEPRTQRDGPPIVLHAPSHRGVKGTRHVVAAVERLRGEGVAIDFRLVEGMRHDEARRLYAQADILVDQLLIGWYGGLGVELMALGKPVICFLREADLHFIPEAMRAELPIIRADAASIYEVLRAQLAARDALARIGEASRRFVERWHDPLAIARSCAADYADLRMNARRTAAGNGRSGAVTLAH